MLEEVFLIKQWRWPLNEQKTCMGGIKNKLKFFNMREFPPTSTTAQKKTHCQHKNIQFHIHVLRLCFHVIITKFYKWVFELSFDHVF